MWKMPATVYALSGWWWRSDEDNKLFAYRNYPCVHLFQLQLNARAMWLMQSFPLNFSRSSWTTSETLSCCVGHSWCYCVLDVRLCLLSSPVDLTMSSGMNILLQLQVACRDGASHFLFVVRHQCLGRLSSEEKWKMGHPCKLQTTT